MVNRLLLERILADIKSNVKDLKNANDITWDVYRTDIRERRFVERTLHITIEAVSMSPSILFLMKICENQQLSRYFYGIDGKQDSKNR